MTWLLSLFPQYRALLASLRESETQRLLLQDRLDATLSDRAQMWELMREALNNERDALRQQVNYATQQRFGVTPYPEAQHLPDEILPDRENNTTVYRRPLPSEAIAAATEKFKRQLADKLAAQMKATG